MPPNPPSHQFSTSASIFLSSTFLCGLLYWDLRFRNNVRMCRGSREDAYDSITVLLGLSYLFFLWKNSGRVGSRSTERLHGIRY